MVSEAALPSLRPCFPLTCRIFLSHAAFCSLRPQYSILRQHLVSILLTQAAFNSQSAVFHSIRPHAALSDRMPLSKAAFCCLRRHLAQSHHIPAEQRGYMISLAFLNSDGTLSRTCNRGTKLEYNKAKIEI